MSDNASRDDILDFLQEIGQPADFADLFLEAVNEEPGDQMRAAEPLAVRISRASHNVSPQEPGEWVRDGDDEEFEEEDTDSDEYLASNEQILRAVKGTRVPEPPTPRKWTVEQRTERIACDLAGMRILSEYLVEAAQQARDGLVSDRWWGLGEFAVLEGLVQKMSPYAKSMSEQLVELAREESTPESAWLDRAAARRAELGDSVE